RGGMRTPERIMDSSASPLRQSHIAENAMWPHRAPSPSPFEANGRFERPHSHQVLSMELHRLKRASVRAILFGPFRLLPTQRLLLHEEVSIPLGSRAMDILIALVERPGELVSKEELMARVWPTTFVAAANLTVQLCAVRRALGDGRNGNRYVINIPGRG